MIALIGVAGLVLAFLTGVCLGAAAVEDVDGELRLSAGWWVLPGAILGGLLMAAVVVGMGA
ncbi:hypothetical protein SAMN05421641_1055 [Paracoccus thiocyanatus]|uniref:Uncharacterized protein n=1 Tax=Paracoccus thiocyanatus TaxID=34006 RepID=A0A1N6R034_9RHOB|nr:hypothetical protein [Paracoccus thiocyanatus]SIQ22179.1 hypothetical protein SAMN05421641_1055 [Paracoccus thiocyanatus]